ncbi:Uncharacterised protein [Serratia entomophila]|uniref:HEPN domain-containing protein n=1 Tax=Serratia entomophila TaxID=42906 RepID=UPI00217B83B3|nr:HEPN domain-containing protein [Serratia entomophila]CAI0766212.1 Uncharacterised protein [Serratia entomophila]
MKVEILITQASKSNLCKDKKSFTHLLQSDSNIIISGSKLKYLNTEFSLKISTLKASSANHKCFHMIVEGNIDNIERLSSLRNLLIHHFKSVLGTPPQIIWDDIDTHYSEKAYLIIKDIENLMRKCLTQFCLVNAGLGWIKETIPSELNSKFQRNTNESDSNYLAGTDFIDLSIILFSKYTKHDVQSIFKKIHNSKTTDDIQSITEMLPKSNWERYFKEHINLDENELEKNWSELYILRCKVAHNKSFTKNDLDELVRLSGIVKPIILSAIGKLNLIEVPDEEKETIILNNAINISEPERKTIKPLIQKENKTQEYNEQIANSVFNSQKYKDLLESSGFGSQRYKELLESTGLASQKYKDLLESGGFGSQRYKELLESTGLASQKYKDLLESGGFGSQRYKELIESTGLASQKYKDLLESGGFGSQRDKALFESLAFPPPSYKETIPDETTEKSPKSEQVEIKNKKANNPDEDEEK